MSSRSDRSALKIVFVCLWLLASFSSAALNFVLPTENCTSSSAIGEATFCCDGDCLDGTNIFTSGGLCGHFNDGCNDPFFSPSCASQNEVFTSGGADFIDAGIATPCYLWCTWEQFNYTWSCCECPTGYIAVGHDCSSQNFPYAFSCVGCDPGEALSFNQTSSEYICEDASLKGVLCALAGVLKNITDILGPFSNFVSAICPTKQFVSLIENLLMDAYSLLQAKRDPTPGLTGSTFGAATAVIGTITSLSIGGLAVVGAGAVSVPAGIATAVVTTYVQVCRLNGVVGPILTILSGIGDSYLRTQCPASSRRFISSEADGKFIPPTLDILSRRDNYNPCAEVVSILPFDYTLPAALNDACNEIQLYSPSSINDTDMANALTNLQQFCADYQDSGASDLIIKFANMLSALEGAIPYCNSTATAPTFTLPTTSTSTSTSIFSNLSATTESSTFSTTSPISLTTSLISSTSISSNISTTSETSIYSTTPPITPTTSSTPSVSDLSVTSPTISSSVTSSSEQSSFSSLLSSSGTLTSMSSSTSSALSSTSSSISSSSVNSSTPSPITTTKTSSSSPTPPYNSSTLSSSSKNTPIASSSTKSITISQKPCSSSIRRSSSPTSSASSKTTRTSISSTKSSISSPTSSRSSIRPISSPSFLTSSKNTQIPTTSTKPSTSSQTSSSHSNPSNTSSKFLTSSKSTRIPTCSTTSSTSSRTSSKAPSAPKWTKLGCFTDLVNGRGRTLTRRKSTHGGSTALTVELCEDECKKAGYIYAGLEYAGECWCGNKFENGGVHLGADGTNGCTMLCKGNRAELCGGERRLSVYGWA